MKFAFLNLYKHPRGYHILENLLKSNYIPKIVIEEKSGLSKKNRVIQINDLKITKEKDVDFKNYNFKHLVVSNLNNETTKIALEKEDVDLIVLGDCRIIKPAIFNTAKIGAINAHPGYLPFVRGNTPYIWALIHNLPQGCSVHFIDEGIDTGPIIYREKISIKYIFEYNKLLEILYQSCSKLIIKVLNDYANTEKISTIDQKDLLKEELNYHYFTLASEKYKNKAKQILKKNV